MGFVDKLKSIFFEEEDDDDDIEDTKPLKTSKKDEKIAKKVEVSKVEKEEEKKEEPVEERKEEIKEEKKEEPKVKINTELIFDDDDFIFDKPQEVKVEPKREEKKRETPVISKKVDIPSKSKEVKVEIPKEKVEPMKSVKSKETYVYTKKVETTKKTFTPSPIISPIYGILDKNYKKEEVKENTEIRLSSRPSRVDFDSVRNKAFGDLEYDLFDDIGDDKKEEPKEIVLEDEKKENKKKKIEKITKSEDDSKPTIDKVTIGEADEYYNDLGLAYNTDYKDLSKDIILYPRKEMGNIAIINCVNVYTRNLYKRWLIKYTTELPEIDGSGV